MDAVVTYDVSDRQDDVRFLMLARGYRDYWPCGPAQNGPAGARLVKRNTGLLEALQDIKAAAIECRVTLQHALVVPSAP